MWVSLVIRLKVGYNFIFKASMSLEANASQAAGLQVERYTPPPSKYRDHLDPYLPVYKVLVYHGSCSDTRIIYFIVYTTGKVCLWCRYSDVPLSGVAKRVKDKDSGQSGQTGLVMTKVYP